jgi:chromosome segregation ATPase
MDTIDGESSLRPGEVSSMREQLAQANQKIAQLEAKLEAASCRKDHLSSAEASGDVSQTIDALLAAQSNSLPPVLIVLIALFCFLLGRNFKAANYM